MDFIPELPLSNGFNNILVIVAIFIPTNHYNEVETAGLFFTVLFQNFVFHGK